MKLFFKLMLVAAMIGLIAGYQLPVLAGDGGQTSAEVLRIAPGAANSAMGGAGVASIAGPAALHYNPAGLAFATDRDLELTYQQLVEDISYGNVDYIHGLSPDHRIAGGLRYLDYGSVERIELVGGQLQQTGRFSDFDMVASLGFAENRGNWSWGAAAKIIHLEIDGESANAFALDAGLQWHSQNPELPLSAGIMVANLGTQPKFDSESEDLPLLTRFGISYDLEHDLGVNMLTHFDFDYQFHSEELGFLWGLEWQATDTFALRGGYDGTIDDVDNGLTAGLGITIDERMDFDYAYIPFGDFGDLHRLAFRYNLGGN